MDRRLCGCGRIVDGVLYVVFFFNDTATTEIYTLSLHDALPISLPHRELVSTKIRGAAAPRINQYKKQGRCRNEKWAEKKAGADRKSTRLNSSHVKRSRMPSSA